MARFIIERYDPDYRDEETGKIPWSVFDTLNPHKGRETFTTRAEALAYKKEMEKTMIPKGIRMKKYNIVFSYSVQETAKDQETAIDNVWEKFARANPFTYREFEFLTIEEIEVTE